ncbi:MAG: DUF4442 domain-containing protein [Bacteroidota bacterium]
MSVYQKLAEVGTKFFKRHALFKYGFNGSPMYRRSTGRVKRVSEDLMFVEIKLPIGYKNRNYMNSIFGGSMFSAVDPIPMVQLVQLLGKDYVIWDRSAEISFKRPAREDLYAQFTYSLEELNEIRAQVQKNKETHIVKTTYLTNKKGDMVYCEVKKTIYIANKAFYKEKKKGQ